MPDTGTLGADLLKSLLEEIYSHKAADSQDARWVMNGEWLRECRKLADSHGSPLWVPSLSPAGQPVLLGYLVEVREDGGIPHLEVPGHG